MSRRRFRDREPFTPTSESAPRWRDRLPGRRPEKYFRWRGHQVSRIEGLSDAVFGFALTLLVVASEVPRTIDGLWRVMRDFPAFVACFAILMIFWNEHYRFFRRYGLEDFFTRSVNYVILLLILFSVYPIKFLFTAWLGSGAGSVVGPVSSTQVFKVYQVYGFGFAAIWLLFTLLQWYALRKREELQLTPVEIVLSRLELNGHLINVSVCLLSVIVSFFTTRTWLPGVVYFLLGPLMGINGFWHGAKVTRLLEQENRSRRDEATP